jgi:hypothetical protein
MGRNIVIKLAILLVVAALVYSVFWFFKVGQVEKQIKEFVSNNSSYVSAGEIVVSGFPLAQKITIKNLKFTIPNAALDKNQVLIPHLEATAGILASDYKIALVETVSVQDPDGNLFSVEFAKDPEINFSMLDGNIAKFHYQDSGYRILGADKSVIYSSTNSTVSLKNNVEMDKITNLISVSIKEIEGFDIISLYKNILEKKVVDGIKTGEISLSNNPAPAANSEQVVPDVLAGQQVATLTTPAQVVTPATPTTNAVVSTSVDSSVVATPTTKEAVADPVLSNNAPAPATISDTSLVKSDLTLELEYVLTPIKVEGQQANIPQDPTQIQEAPSQHSKTVKITSLEFSNPLYKITINGEMSSLPDDSLPSGGITIKVEKITNLITQISTNFAQMANKTKSPVIAKPEPTDTAKPADSTITPASVVDDLLRGTSAVPVEDPYRTFLVRVAANFSAVIKEISAKNAASKDDVAQFDVRREKNLDFLINETSTREILGKF